MKLHARLGLLILCVLWFVGMIAPTLAFAGASAPPEPVIYYTDDVSEQNVYLMPGPDFVDVLYEADSGSVFFSPEGGGEALSFNYLWNECQEDFDEAVESGKEEFILTSSCEPGDDWGAEDLSRWEAGLIQIRRASLPRIIVHIRPANWVTVYRPREADSSFCTVAPGDSFEDARVPGEATLYQEDSPYEYEWCDFAVNWSRDEYEAGMARCLAEGLDSFDITGSYAACLREAYAPLFQEGLITAAGTPRMSVRVKAPVPPDQPLVYDNPIENGDSHSPCSYDLTAARGAAMTDMGAPEEVMLVLRGSPDNDRSYKEFRYAWDESEFIAGMESGEPAFTVHGTYLPGDWSRTELSWWDQGLIRVADTAPVPVLNIRVTEPGETLPFSVELVHRNGGLVPKFVFPCPNGASRVVCAFSPDGETWYEEELEPYYYESIGEVWFYLITGDGSGGFAYATMDVPSYYKITVEGSAYPGETPLLVLNAGEDDLPDGSTDGGSGDGGDDDQGGDRGGGGQGSHDRPGKVEQEPEVPPELTPPELPPVTGLPPALPTDETAGTLWDGETDRALPASGGELTGRELSAPDGRGTDSGAASFSGRGAGTAGSAGAGLWADPADRSNPGQTAGAGAGPVAEDSEPDPALPASGGPGMNLGANPGVGATAGNIPGFAAASAVTAALILGCAGWFCRRGKRK